MLSLKQVLKAIFRFTPLNISSQNFEDLEPYIPNDMSGYEQIFKRGKNDPHKGDDVFLFIVEKHRLGSRVAYRNIRPLIYQLNKIFLDLRHFCVIARHTQIPDEIEGEIALIYLNFYHQELYQLLSFLEEEE